MGLVSAVRTIAADRPAAELGAVAQRIPGATRDPSGGAAGDGAALAVAPPAPVAALDARLARLAHREARCRLAAAFCSLHGHHQMGFARLGDYARERLGLSAREVQSVAAVARASVALPRLTAAFLGGELSWTKLRLLCDLARSDDEHRWLAEARAQPSRALRDPYADRAAPDFDPNAADAIEGETPVRVRIACPWHVRCRWHRAVELARRMMGEQAPVWRAAEAIASEALAGAPRRRPGALGCTDEACGGAAMECRNGSPCDRADGAGPPTRPRARRRFPFVARAPRSAIHRGCRNPTAGAGAKRREPVGLRPAPRLVRTLFDRRAPSPPVATHPRSRHARRVDAARSHRPALDAEIGRALAAAVAQHLPRALGFPSLAAYARARLGISAGKARALLALDRRAGRIAGFGAAYARGELSWARALTLLPVVSTSTADAWVARAQAITVRALEGEVEEALDRWDATPAAGMPGPRPPEAPARVGGARWEAEPAVPETGDLPASETGDPVARETGDLATSDPGDPDASQDKRGCEVARPDQRDRAPALGPDSTRERQMGAHSTVRPGTPTPHPARPLWVVRPGVCRAAEPPRSSRPRPLPGR